MITKASFSASTRAGLNLNSAGTQLLSITEDDTKEVLGLWIEQTEGAKLWLRVMTELRERGVEDILIAVVDGIGHLQKPLAEAVIG